MSQINIQDVKHIAGLANIPLSDSAADAITTAFQETLAVVDELRSVDVTGVEPTHQVTGLENVLRADVVTPETMFSQQEALANASNTHAGFFVVPRLIDES